MAVIDRRVSFCGWSGSWVGALYLRGWRRHTEESAAMVSRARTRFRAVDDVVRGERVNPLATIAFPALCVPRGFGVYLVRDLSELRKARAQLFWKYRHFDGLRVYDCHGRAYEITAARVVKPESKLGQRLARLLDLRVSVDVEIAAIGDASLPEVASAVERGVGVDAESFEELSGRSVEWWRATLGRVSSVQGVIRAFDG